MVVDFRQGDSLEILRGMPGESVNCCVTSPPYWGLRDYGTAKWEGGDAGCDHKQTVARNDGGRTSVDGFHGSSKPDSDKGSINYRYICGKCGARRIDSQLGLERTPEEYVARLVEVFREVRRVLRRDGTLWLNLGDSYSCQGGAHGGRQDNQMGVGAKKAHLNGSGDQYLRQSPDGLKPKDLVGIPWRVAFALQADGWYLRSDIIWAKPNPMPESVRDRPTRSHEYLFLLSKSGDAQFWAHRDKDYAECSRTQRTKPAPDYRWRDTANENQETAEEPADWRTELRPDGKRRWSRINLWQGCDYYYDADAIAEPFADERNGSPGGKKKAQRNVGGRTDGYTQPPQDWVAPTGCKGRNRRSVWTIATAPYKGAHFATFPPKLIEPCILAGCPPGGWVLDPFMGSGTTCLIAKQTGRNAIGIELNPAYIKLARERTGERLLLAEGGVN